MEIDLLSLATEIAIEAHKGQVDKAGKDYILHPLRVSSMCDTLEEKIVAVLHDTIEDTFVTGDYLKSKGFQDFIIEAIESVTRKKNEAYQDFIRRCDNNPIGRIVKMNDLKDNMDLTRLDIIREIDLERLRKYHDAYKYLECLR